jgi:exodeoxyribonuclease-1
MAGFSFFWHDYETFGRVPRRDRPAQFAGVRTDAELNEIDAPLMLHCQPPTDQLPDPESCLLTGILPQHCAQVGVPEHAFAAAVEAQLALPGTVGVGYNSIRFDDEVTRHLFWRNLIDPYAREWQNECARWDLMDAVRCAYALRPDGIEWPRREDGSASFKLEHLTAANGLAHAAAHDALSDVRATIALARLLRLRHPRLWDFCLKLRHKSAVQAELVLGKPLLHVSGMYPAERGCIAAVFPLATHPTNKNEVIVWDLVADPAELMVLDATAIRQRLFTRSEDLAEGQTRLPIKTVHINKSPVVIGKLNTLSPAMAERWGVDLDQSHRHAETAARIAGSMAGVWPGVFTRDSPAEAPDVDEDLYGGFVGNDDRRMLQRLRELTPDALASKHPQFHDGRLEELLFRYRARNFPATLDGAEQARWAEHRRSRLFDGAAGFTTLAAFFERIDTLNVDADERAGDILSALYDWAEQIAPEH